MPRNLLAVIVFLAAYPVWGQANYPSTTPMDQPFSPQLTAGEPQSMSRPVAAASATYPPPTAPASPAYPQPVAPATPTYPRPMAQQQAPGSTQYQYQVVPPAAPTPTSGVGIMIEDGRFRESTWYTRIDYFHWNERVDNADFVNEYGTLITLGYENRFEQQRYRGEFFGATMLYVGSSQQPGVPDVPLHSTTKYLGFRLEYEYLIEPEGLPQVSFFAGLGTRFWVRDMPDDFDDNGDPVTGYQETWWTIYPYIGIEKRRTHDDGPEFYYSARIGCTPVTYQRIEDFETTLYPQCGLTGQVELGVRGRRFLLSAYFEAMSWTQSDVVRDSLQPASSFTTFGFKAGYCF
jgi:hypothetical protein